VTNTTYFTGPPADTETGTFKNCATETSSEGRCFRRPAGGYSPYSMNTALIDHYRCPDEYPEFESNGPLSNDAGYFRFGPHTICYGRTASGFRATRADEALYDALENTANEGSALRLPFDPSDVIDNLRLERYAKGRHGVWNVWNRSLKNVYYLLRPLMSVNVRKHLQRAHLRGWQTLPFPRWPVDTTVEDLCDQLLFLSMKAKGIEKVPFIWFWPGGAQSAMAMTHDVETEQGISFCSELMDIDDSFGLKASIQLVPEGRYKVSANFIQGIHDRGFEVNLQDLNHDGRLFDNHRQFLRRAERINEYVSSYQTDGFRAAVLYRNLEWIGALDISFDMSVPNVAHLDPQRGGCCTVMPYFVGDILEIPVTTTQDYVLFHLLNDYSLDLWKAQIELILNRNGLATFIVHPDYLGKKRAAALYRALLSYLRCLGQEKKIWFCLPGDINHWWRARSKMRLVRENGKWRINGEGAERAMLAYATIAGDHLEYEFEA